MRIIISPAKQMRVDTDPEGLDPEPLLRGTEDTLGLQR